MTPLKAIRITLVKIIFNLAGVWTFFKFQDKHNMRTLSVNI